MNKFLVFILTTLLSLSAWTMEVPALTGPVVDEAQFLSRSAHAAISNALMNLNQEKGIQFQVLVIDRLLDETIEGYSIKVVDEWKLGKKGEDKAALFLISLEDRKMRIEVGRGLEGEITDLTSRRIIEEVKPFFRNQDYDNGVALGLTLMGRAAGVELKFAEGSVRPRHQRRISSSFIMIILFIVITFLQLFTRRGRRGMYSSGYGGWSGGSGWGGGGGFGGGSSGGSWGGGGGGFSGGGSSGSW